MRKSIHLLLFFVAINFSYAQNNNHNQLIENAIKTAKEKNKQVFVNYFSEKCEFSDYMKQRMKDENFANVFNSHYIVVNIEVPIEETNEFVNCSNPVKSFKGDSCEKIKFPFWYILDTSGNFAETSFKDDNYNIGYPNTKKDRTLFMEAIRNTSEFSENNLNFIKNSFIKVASN